MGPKDYIETWDDIEEMRSQYVCPVDVFGGHCLSDRNETPAGRFRYLLGLILSARNLDRVTALAMYRLNALAPLTSVDIDEAIQRLTVEFDRRAGGVQQRPKNPIKRINFVGDPTAVMQLDWRLDAEAIANSTEEALAKAIHPTGFAKTKASYMRKVAQICLQKYGGDVPDTLEAFLELPGVGPKMAHLAMQITRGMAVGVSVDAHVCRIAQRLRWVSGGDCEKGGQSLSPVEVGRQLEEFLPSDRWPLVNPLLVGFGQVICRAQDPNCDECKLKGERCYYQKVTRGKSKASKG